MYNILLAVTGSVAAIKVPELVEKFSQFGEVKIVVTKAGKYFLRDRSDLVLLEDDDEWSDSYQIGDPILHIELRRWANCLVLAPLDANSLAKIANGICDNLLTSVVRAWDWNKPMFICPSMNTFMWENEPTMQHIETMQDREAILIPPVEKKLACGDIGIGAMAPVDEIVSMVRRKLQWYFPLSHCNGIPVNHHPGAFGFRRKKNFHTGVDLYTREGEFVSAVESGTVVKIEQFTGPEIGHDWWETTWGVMVEGAVGVVNYGEITPVPSMKVGDKLFPGQSVGRVKRVLFENRLRPDIPGHSTSMLHLELYKHGSREFAHWHDPVKEPELLDPTQHLLLSENAPKNILTWDNSENKPVG